MPSGENTVTSCFANNPVQSASHMGPTPTRVLMKDGIMYPVFENMPPTAGLAVRPSPTTSLHVRYPCLHNVLGYLCQEVYAELLGPFRGGLCQSLLRQCHSAGDSVEFPLLCWLGGYV